MQKGFEEVLVVSITGQKYFSNNSNHNDVGYSADLHISNQVARHDLLGSRLIYGWLTCYYYKA